MLGGDLHQLRDTIGARAGRRGGNDLSAAPVCGGTGPALISGGAGLSSEVGSVKLNTPTARSRVRASE
jgi:hypothetical protein